MTATIVIRPATEADIGEAHDWYERKWPGLGVTFITRVDEGQDKLRRSPDLGILVHKQLRRLSVDQFPA